MTDSHERLYALALSLVPDRDVAGDLFMDAASEDDLRRRAANWLRQQGLLVPAESPPLLALPEADRAFAAHLAARRRRRQRGQVSLAVACTVLVLGLAVVALPTLSAAPSADRAEQPVIAAARSADGLDLTVVRVEATPGAVTLWWALRGEGAADTEFQLRLEHQGARVEHHRQETDRSRPNRVTGRTTFRVPLGEKSSVGVLLYRAPDREPISHLTLLLEPGPDPDAQVVPVNQRILSPDKSVTVEVHAITRAPDYTLVHYTATGDPLRVIQAHQLELWAAGQDQLGRNGVVRRGPAPDERVVAYSPMPDGATSVELRFPGLVQREWRSAVYRLPAPDLVQKWVRDGEELQARLAFPRDVIIESPTVQLVDKAGRHHDIPVRAMKRGYGPVVELIRVTGLPPDDQLDQVVIHGVGRDLGMPTLRVDLLAHN